MLGALVASLFVRQLAKILIDRRTDPVPAIWPCQRDWRWSLALLLVNVAGSLGLYVVAQDAWTLVIWLVYFQIALTIAIVDYRIRKIPNELLAALLIIRIAEWVIFKLPDAIIPSLVGLILGYFVAIIPSQFGKYIGKGDLKYMAVIGFCLTWRGLLQTIAILGIVAILVIILLFSSRRGNLKTKIAIGPILSLGLYISLIYRII
jgi:Flp pilus assembly protein protease CpaA